MQAPHEGSSADSDARRKQQAEQEQMRSAMLARILTPDARERLSRIGMVRADRARSLEDFLINAARSGQVRGSSPNGQITESDLVSILERISSQETAAKEAVSKVRFQRRNAFDDEDDF